MLALKWVYCGWELSEYVSIVQAFVHCRLDYCNAILTGAADRQIRRLQAVQNAAARLV